LNVLHEESKPPVYVYERDQVRSLLTLKAFGNLKEIVAESVWQLEGITLKALANFSPGLCFGNPGFTGTY